MRCRTSDAMMHCVVVVAMMHCVVACAVQWPMVLLCHATAGEILGEGVECLGYFSGGEGGGVLRYRGIGVEYIGGEG
jgi:hypothetical protein